ncbi:flagellar hook-associated protein FlgL [Shewanella submarina]|uniref:Flagellar hook-associated protein FlgL n=1 Tax=Shewanella submarina TaxID=2016376 RepID=A0ABV7GC74_9GAMM|nr:flagellar hook-associated protein FlgL [Shewanella submarina]MCL1038724.1 flagellar hook-associated protein FlgL [Shewanella submarina]
MRVAMLNMYTSNIYSMQSSLSTMAHLEQQMASSKAILRPSDDPIGTVKVLTSERHLAATEQYIDNIDSLSSSLERSETYLSGMVDLQNRMREISLLAANGSSSAEDRAAYASELTELLESMVDSVNAKDEAGNYLFSGNLTNTPAVAKDASGQYVYQGDNNHREVQTSANAWTEANVTAGEFMFANGSMDILNQTQQLIDALNDPAQGPGEAGFDNLVSGMMTTLNDSMDSFNAAITDIGGKQNSLELAKGAHEEMVLFNEEVIGETEALDYPSAVSEFQMRLTALQVSQQSFVKISQLTLFNHM